MRYDDLVICSTSLKPEKKQVVTPFPEKFKYDDPSLVPRADSSKNKPEFMALQTTGPMRRGVGGK